MNMTPLSHRQSPSHAESITGCSQVFPTCKGQVCHCRLLRWQRASPLCCLQVMKNDCTYLKTWLALKGLEWENMVSQLNPIICWTQKLYQNNYFEEECRRWRLRVRRPELEDYWLFTNQGSEQAHSNVVKSCKPLTQFQLSTEIT